MDSSTPASNASPLRITGVILAGGRGSRLGGVDKGLLDVAGRPLVEHALHALAPQVDRLIISANRNLDAYARLGCPVVSDAEGDYPGPLGGMLSALRQCPTDYLLTLPCDCPMLSTNYRQVMEAALLRDRRRASVAHDGERMQPVFALLARELVDELADYLARGERRTGQWLNSLPPALADLSASPEQFLNINTPADREHVGRLLEART